MKTSGNPFVDFARGNIIKYAWRMKREADHLFIEDLKKARHYCDAAIEALEKK